MNKTTRNLVQEINDEFKKIKTLKESCIFDDEEYGYDEFNAEEEMIEEPNEEEGEVVENEIINQIRKLAFKGLQRYEDNIKAPEYDLFKRVWQICDKFALNDNKIKE